MPLKDNNAFVQWYETLSSSISNQSKKDKKTKTTNKDHLIGPFQIDSDWRYDDNVPLPDIFIYLCAQEITSKKMKPVSYYRCPLRQILSTGILYMKYI